LRLIDFVHHSTLGLREIKKKNVDDTGANKMLTLGIIPFFPVATLNPESYTLHSRVVRGQSERERERESAREKEKERGAKCH